MIKAKLRVLLILFFVYATLSLKAQEANLLFMGNEPANNFYNPAFHSDSTCVYLSPNIFVNLGSSSFGLKKLFTRKDTSDKKYWDLPYILENTDRNNFVNLDFDYTLVHIGKKLNGGYYLSFSISQRNHFNLSFPRELLELTNGNVHYETETPRSFNLDGLSLNSFIYSAYSLGFSKEFGPCFRFGISLNLLKGEYVTKTRNFEASVNTHDDFDTISIDATIFYQQSTSGMNTNEVDDHMFSMVDVPKQLLLYNNLSHFFKNLGAAADVGFVYTPNQKTSVFGSVSDIGFIHWNSDQLGIHYDGIFDFSGFNVSPGSTNKFGFMDSYNLLVDSLQTTFKPEFDKTSSFRTWLPPRISVGVNRSMNPRFDLFGLLRTRLYSLHTDSHFIVGGIYKPTQWLNASCSTSYKNKRFGNIGAGVMFRLYKRLEFFMASENIDLLFLNDAKSLNLALGMNIRIK